MEEYKKGYKEKRRIEIETGTDGGEMKTYEGTSIFDGTEEYEKTLPTHLTRHSYHIPPGIEILRLMSELEIEAKWKNSIKIFPLAFATMWFGILLVMTMGMIASGNFFSLLFLAPFYFAGSTLLYRTFGQLFNKTLVRVNEEHLIIEHKPFNFLIKRDQFVKSEEIVQLYVKKNRTGVINGNEVYGYAIHVILNDGKRLIVLDKIPSLESAHFIESEIEHFLNIEDLKVAGEIKKKG